MKRKFSITGMACASCQQNIQKAVNGIRGVSNVNVNLVSATMTLECDNNVSAQSIIEKVSSIGYEAIELDNQISNTTEEKQQLKKKLIKQIISLLIWLPLMIFTMSTMHSNKHILFFGIIQLILTTVILTLNFQFFVKGYKALFKLMPNMDTLVAISATAAYVYGIIVMVFSAVGYHVEHALYFESAATIVTLVALGKYFEMRAKVHTSNALDKLINLTPQSCTIIKGGRQLTVPIKELALNDIILIKPGDIIPVDGIIVSGNGLLNQSAITGESLPVAKNVGDTVTSATYNENGTFNFQATKIGKDTTLSQIIKLVDQAGNSKAPIARLADKVSGVFVPIVISIALITLITWWIISRDFAVAFNFGISS